jgi:hypothetical protein
MILNGPIAVFFGGALGWLLVELCKFGLAAAHSAAIDPKYKSPTFWLGAIALICVSGIVAVLNGVQDVPLLRAVQFGISAPQLSAGWLHREN